MNREDLEASWRRTRAHLAAGAGCAEAEGTALHELKGYRAFLDHNELELALNELEAVAETRPQSPQFWTHLRDAAEEMNLVSRVVSLRYRIAGATWGYYEAVLSLRSTEEGGRGHPLSTGFRCPWDIGAVYDGRPTLNDAAVVLLHTPDLAPGDTAEVRLHPLAPEFWSNDLVGRTVRPWDGQFFGEAVISSAVAPWSERHR
jgi:hypothetical protein